MSSTRPSDGIGLVKLRLSGMAFLLVIAGLVGLTVLIYQKTFTPVVHVELKADHIGNQLSPPSDVKLRGLVVGEVRKVRSTGDGATIELALQPDKVGMIPANVRAQLLPKTLFGEKFVALVLPADTVASGHLREGSVIPQDRSTTALETEKVLDDLMPVLQTLQPEKLSLALNALSGALRGRGNRIGVTFAAQDAYLKKLNPQLPTLRADMQGLADFSNNTADAVPDLLRVLDNLSASGRNLTVEQPALHSFLTSTTQFSASADSLLKQNQARFIALASSSKPSLELFARYAPEYPCFLKALAAYEPIVAKTFGGAQPGLHITVEPTQDNGGYKPGQEPKYRDTRGPGCEGLPTPKVPQGAASFDDGYRGTAGSSPDSGSARGASYLDPTGSTSPDRLAVNAVAAPMLGVPVDKVPDLVILLFGPVADGNTVGLA